MHDDGATSNHSHGARRRARHAHAAVDRHVAETAGAARRPRLIVTFWIGWRCAGISKTVVNVHYLADKIEQHLNGPDGAQIVISDERGVL
jgi:hypothetical protein